jgi:hypothetical protein
VLVGSRVGPSPGRRPVSHDGSAPPTAGKAMIMTNYRVGYFVGSLAKASINRTLSKALIRVAPPELEFTEIPIGNLPLYSHDYDQDYPPEARALKESIAAVDAVLFVTPEYNRSIPGALKNAIDWAVRDHWGVTRGDRNGRGPVPARLHGGVPRIHRAGPHRPAQAGVRRAGEPVRTAGWRSGCACSSRAPRRRRRTASRPRRARTGP